MKSRHSYLSLRMVIGVAIAGVVLGAAARSIADCQLRCGGTDCSFGTNGKCYKINRDDDNPGTTCNFWWISEGGCDIGSCVDGELNVKVRWEEQMSCSHLCDPVGNNGAFATTCSDPQGTFLKATCYDSCKIKH